KLRNNQTNEASHPNIIRYDPVRPINPPPPFQQTQNGAESQHRLIKHKTIQLQHSTSKE
ncbi:hypothetical protein S245_037427, partial [Arachis hypogaea]